MPEQVTFQFWLSDTRGLIRLRSGRDWQAHPEVWRDGRWFTGSAYVSDAITGMGEDPYSCGESAVNITRERAEALAAEQGIELYAPNPDDP